MKTMGHPIYHHNVFVATHVFGHMIRRHEKYGYTLQRPLLFIQENLQYIKQIL